MGIEVEEDMRWCKVVWRVKWLEVGKQNVDLLLLCLFGV